MALTKRTVKRYGWVPDIPDQRGQLYGAPVVTLKKLPPKVDLRAQCPMGAYDQRQLGRHAALAAGYDYV